MNLCDRSFNLEKYANYCFACSDRSNMTECNQKHGDILDMALKARGMTLMTSVCMSNPSYKHRAENWYWKATREAYRAGYLFPSEQIPYSLFDVEYLSSAFLFGQYSRNLDDKEHGPVL